jgi:hypothetical protein
MINDPDAPVSLAAHGRGPARQGGIVMPEGQQVPSGLAAGLAIQFVITGDVTSINYSPQTAVGDGTNVTVGGLGAAPVAVAGAHGSATGGQAVQAGWDATATEQQAAAARAEDLPSRESWWARLRKRGLVVALATIVGAIATVVGTAAAICAWVGWTP